MAAMVKLLNYTLCYIIKTNQQDALSVCIYSTIYVQLYMFRTTNSFIIRSLRFAVFCSSVQTMQTCLTARSYGWNCRSKHVELYKKM